MFMKPAILICFIVIAISCGRSGVEGPPERPSQLVPQPTPVPTKPPIAAELLSASPIDLCGRLAQIKTLPTFEPIPTDPIYEALVAKGNAAIPCLIAKISDKTEMPDPRYSVPHVQSFAVGDAAVFTLVDIIEKDDQEREKLLIKMMPLKSQKEWETNGIYAYFNYVSEVKNRKALQRWWERWLEKNKRPAGRSQTR
jgi:hypothetical protein